MAWIENVWVDSSNNLYVRINGVHNYYRLYVRRHGAVFGDPGRGYYQIYPGGIWPKDLLIVVNVQADTVYCIEIISNDGSYQHDIISYKTGTLGPPYYGGVCLNAYCPADYTNNVRLQGSLSINPSDPVAGQSVQATFGTVCNDGWNAVNLNQVYVGVNTGENWPDVGQGVLPACVCGAVSYNQSRSFGAGSKYAAAGWNDGSWHEFGVRDGVFNGRWFTVLTPASVQLRNGSALTLSGNQISPGESISCPFAEM
jgi:hypothetical protein